MTCETIEGKDIRALNARDIHQLGLLEWRSCRTRHNTKIKNVIAGEVVFDFVFCPGADPPQRLPGLKIHRGARCRSCLLERCQVMRWPAFQIRPQCGNKMSD